jgi:hypothetical protein
MAPPKPTPHAPSELPPAVLRELDELVVKVRLRYMNEPSEALANLHDALIGAAHAALQDSPTSIAALRALRAAVKSERDSDVVPKFSTEQRPMMLRPMLLGATELEAVAAIWQSIGRRIHQWHCEPLAWMQDVPPDAIDAVTADDVVALFALDFAGSHALCARATEAPDLASTRFLRALSEDIVRARHDIDQSRARGALRLSRAALRPVVFALLCARGIPPERVTKLLEN